VFGLDERQFKAAFVDTAVKVDALDFRPVLENAEALLAAGQRFLSWKGGGLTESTLWERTTNHLNTFLEQLGQLGLSDRVPLLAEDLTGDKAIAAFALRELAIKLQKPSRIVTGKPQHVGDGLVVPYEEVHGTDVDLWFEQLADTIELLRSATTGEPATMAEQGDSEGQEIGVSTSEKAVARAAKDSNQLQLKASADEPLPKKAYSGSPEAVTHAMGALIQGRSPPRNEVSPSSDHLVRPAASPPLLTMALSPGTASTPSETSKPPDAFSDIDLESQALALLFKHPEWTVAQIADHLKTDRKTPYKWAKFRKAAELQFKLKPRKAKDGIVPRGHKTRDGHLEAYDEKDEGE
jgi:hypothetical protein